MLPCLSKQILNMDCPGCGLQRSIAYLLGGNFAEAFFMYPAIYPILGLLLFLGLDKFIKIPHANKISIALMFLSVGTILTNYILKIIT